ncbi:MAG: CBS domain-containing protein [Kiloniellales bacterium]
MKVESVLEAKGRDIITISSDAKVAEAARMLKDKRIGALVVSDDGTTAVGILSERDIVHAMVDHGPAVQDLLVSDLMTQEVITCAPDDAIVDLMTQMTERRIRHLPVVKDGVLCGMVSIGDVVKNRIEEVETEASAMREFITGY